MELSEFEKTEFWEATKATPENDIMFCLYETGRLVGNTTCSRNEINDVLRLFPAGVRSYVHYVDVENALAEYQTWTHRKFNQCAISLYFMAWDIFLVNQERGRMVGLTVE
eukprot:802605-Karenia_brevis.AAC.1